MKNLAGPDLEVESNPLSDMYRGRVFDNDGFPELLALIKPDERVILDVGCGVGANDRLLVGQGKVVHGITLSEKEARQVRPILASVICGDVERMPLEYPPEYFDAIICSHVLEHLIDPRRTLRRLSKYLRIGGHLYVAVPNVAHYKERAQILLGWSQYGDAGVVDRSHLRFFTFQTTQYLVRDGGYAVTAALAMDGAPLWPLRRWVGTGTRVDRYACHHWPNLFGSHILVVGERRA